MSSLKELEELKRKGIVDNETFDKAKELLEIEERTEQVMSRIEDKMNSLRLILAQ